MSRTLSQPRFEFDGKQYVSIDFALKLEEELDAANQRKATGTYEVPNKRFNAYQLAEAEVYELQRKLEKSKLISEIILYLYQDWLDDVDDFDTVLEKHPEAIKKWIKIYEEIHLVEDTMVANEVKQSLQKLTELIDS